MKQRDLELMAIMNQLAEWKKNHHIRHITMSIDGIERGNAYGWDGTEKIDISAVYKNETPGAATPRESR